MLAYLLFLLSYLVSLATCISMLTEADIRDPRYTNFVPGGYVSNRPVPDDYPILESFLFTGSTISGGVYIWQTYAFTEQQLYGTFTPAVGVWCRDVNDTLYLDAISTSFEIDNVTGAFVPVFNYRIYIEFDILEPYKLQATERYLTLIDLADDPVTSPGYEVQNLPVGFIYDRVQLVGVPFRTRERATSENLNHRTTYQ